LAFHEGVAADAHGSPIERADAANKLAAWRRSLMPRNDSPEWKSLSLKEKDVRLRYLKHRRLKAGKLTQGWTPKGFSGRLWRTPLESRLEGIIAAGADAESELEQWRNGVTRDPAR